MNQKNVKLISFTCIEEADISRTDISLFGKYIS